MESSRRSFLRLGIGATALLTLNPSVALAGFRERTISINNRHTGESVREVVYYENGKYLPEGLAEINHLLRDHRTDEMHHMDPHLLDQLYKLKYVMGIEEPFHAVSGYRSPRTNAMLANMSDGVAKNSFHTKGQAIDICLEKRDLVYLKRAALHMHAGGVGFYPGSGFVHLDTGPVRRW